MQSDTFRLSRRTMMTSKATTAVFLPTAVLEAASDAQPTDDHGFKIPLATRALAMAPAETRT